MDVAADKIKERVLANLRELERIPPEQLVERRLEKFLKIGAFDGLPPHRR
jgi:acetyl-CoA carboxylase alpha subunit